MLAPASLLSSFWVHNLDYFISVSSKLNEISIWAESNLLGSGPICHHISPGVCSITALFLSNQIRAGHLTCSAEKEKEGWKEEGIVRSGLHVCVCVHLSKLSDLKLIKRKEVMRQFSFPATLKACFQKKVFNKFGLKWSEAISASSIPTLTQGTDILAKKQKSVREGIH